MSLTETARSFSGNSPEIIKEIIQQFRNDHDHKTLHSCIFVSKFWCHLAMPLLWEDPFSINLPKNFYIIEIYLSKISYHDRIKLKDEYGINTDLIPLGTSYDYFSFVKHLSTKKVIQFITQWIIDERTFSTAEFNHYQDDYIKLIFDLLFKIFGNNKVNLHTFEIEIIADDDLNYFDKPFFQSILIKKFIGGIKTFRFRFNKMNGDTKRFLKFVYINCHSISSFYFQFPRLGKRYDEDLFKIIQSQQNLKKLSFEGDEFMFSNQHSSLPSELPSSLKDCSNTLETIIFNEIDFINIGVLKKVFDELSVLESVHIIHCYSLNSNFIQQIIKPFKLKSLMVTRQNLQIEPLKLLLKKSGNYLENIGFDLKELKPEPTQQLLESIRTYCAKIRFFKLNGFNIENIYSALGLIEHYRQNLNYLSINFAGFNNKATNINCEISSIVLLNLGQVLPSKLKYLSLTLEFNSSNLTVFLKNSQNTFIEKLLIRNKTQSIGNILSPIKEYIMKERRVKYLGFEEFCSEDKKDLYSFKDEVREFRSYNIRVQRYIDLEIRDVNFVREMY